MTGNYQFDYFTRAEISALVQNLQSFGMVNYGKHIAIMGNIVIASLLFKIILLYLQNKRPHNGYE